MVCATPISVMGLVCSGEISITQREQGFINNYYIKGKCHQPMGKHNDSRNGVCTYRGAHESNFMHGLKSAINWLIGWIGRALLVQPPSKRLTGFLFL